MNKNYLGCHKVTSVIQASKSRRGQEIRNVDTGRAGILSEMANWQADLFENQWANNGKK